MVILLEDASPSCHPRAFKELYMKIKDLIKVLKKVDKEKEVYIQLNDGDYYSHYEIVVQFTGHPGHDGVILHTGRPPVTFAQKVGNSG